MIKTLYGLKLSQESPSGLVYATSVYSGNKKLEKTVGDVAGIIGSNGRWQVHVQGFQYPEQGFYVQAHLIVWSLHYGIIPDGMFIDHKDGNCLNNKIENLRLVTHEVNMKNKAKYKNNSTGITGVYLDSRGNYVASWNHGGKKFKKSFSSSKYGEQNALNLAVECRDYHISLDKDYTERHGG